MGEAAIFTVCGACGTGMVRRPSAPCPLCLGKGYDEHGRLAGDAEPEPAGDGIDPRRPIRVVRLEQTCRACPSQWEGWTSDGAEVYVRYRWGELTVHVGPDPVMREPVFAWESGDGMDGYMDLDELKARLPEWIVIEAAADREATDPP